MPHYADLTSVAADMQSKAILLSGDSIAFLLTAMGEYLENRHVWSGSGEFGTTTDTEWDEASAVIAKAERELMGNLTGTIIMSAVDVPGTLECDGSRYLRTDYPDLWAKIKQAYDDGLTLLEVDETYFYVPDLINRFPLGGVPSGYLAGESEHTLTVDEMPAHAHEYIQASEVTINGGLEAPAFAAVPVPGTTTIVGSGLPHNNMPPLCTIRFLIWT